MVLTSNGKELILQNSKMFIHWLPRPRIQFSGTPESGAPILTFGQNQGKETLEIEEFGINASVLVTDAHYGTQGSEISGILNESIDIGDITTSISHIDFALVNFHNFVGKSIRPSSLETLCSWQGRLEFITDEWMLTIDQIRDLKGIEKKLRVEGGYSISHGGRLQRIDNASFHMDECVQILEALPFFLAFFQGYWCGPIFEVGIQGNNRVWQRIGPRKLSPWKHSRNWFPYLGQADSPSFSQIFQNFLALWIKDDWEVPLRHYISWYIEMISIAEAHESTIVMSQIALELLGWVNLVEEKSIISTKGFKDIQASDKLRLLLSHFGIPRDIPTNLKALHAAASSLGEDDGPGVFTQLRNAIIHPSRKKRITLSKLPRGIMFEAADLGQWYVEMALLSLLGYTGYHRNIVNRSNYELVPYLPVPTSGCHPQTGVS